MLLKGLMDNQHSLRGFYIKFFRRNNPIVNQDLFPVYLKHNYGFFLNISVKVFSQVLLVVL